MRQTARSSLAPQPRSAPGMGRRRGFASEPRHRDRAVTKLHGKSGRQYFASLCALGGQLLPRTMVPCLTGLLASYLMRDAAPSKAPPTARTARPIVDTVPAMPPNLENIG